MYTTEQQVVMTMDRLNLALDLGKINVWTYHLKARKMFRDLNVKFLRVNERLQPVTIQ